MAEIPNSLQSLFTTRLKERNERYLLEVPESEIKHEAIDPSQTYQVALLEQTNEPRTQESTEPTDQQPENHSEKQTPPVEEGEKLTVTIDSIGDQGDGVALVEHGYVVIVPDTKPEDTVKIEIRDVTENFAFADVIEHKEAGNTNSQGSRGY